MENDTVTAQLVMKTAEGRSVLDLESPLTSGSPERAAADLPEARIDHIRARLGALGFTVGAASAQTLSVSGPAPLFLEHFGLDPRAMAADGAAHAARIGEELAPFVADVFVAPPPEFFP